MAAESFISLWSALEKFVGRAAIAFDGQWQRRKRRIDTRLLLFFIFRLVLAKNSQGYGVTLDELWEDGKQRLGLCGKAVSRSSIAAARRKLHEGVFRLLNEGIVAAFEAACPRQALWYGHRVFAIDGTKLSLPRALTAQGFPVPSNGFYPMGLVSCLYRLAAKIPYDFQLARHGDERACVFDHLQHLQRGDVVVYDAGYLSYVLLNRHIQTGIYCVFRVQEGSTFKTIDAFRHSSARDRVVDLWPGHRALEKRRKEQPDVLQVPLRIRLIKYRVDGVEHCLVTNLVSKRYKIKHLARLYHGRWSLEELYKVSKRLIEVEDFHTKSERGVRQELYANFVLISLARLIASQAEWHQMGGREPRRVEARLFHRVQANFKHVLTLLERHLMDLLVRRPRAALQRLLAELLDRVIRLSTKARPGRHYARRSKRPFRRWMPNAHASQPA